jgi:hypothetical protein
MNKLEIEMERRRVLHNAENKEITLRILDSIKFNKECMLLYKNSDFDKIKRLLIDNINLYNQLSHFRQIQKYKPIQTKETKKEVLESEFDDYVSRDTTIETFDLD